MAGRLARQPHQRERLTLARVLATSPRRLHGWEPLEFHRGYDRDGNQVPIAEAFEIVVEREAEYDDDDRTQLLSLARYDGEVCQCGYHESMTADDANVWMPATRTCPVCAGLDQYRRQEHAADEEARKKGEAEKRPPRAPLPSDGRTTYMELLDPARAEAARKRHQSRRGVSDGNS
jgi:hypothetical protein